MSFETKDKLNRWLTRLPLHVVVIGLCLIWLVPTLGLLVTSLRPVQHVDESGWWDVLDQPAGTGEYKQYCASCHGSDGQALPNADLSDPELVGTFRRSSRLRATFEQEYDGQVHIPADQQPDKAQSADILEHIQRLSGVGTQLSKLFTNNYVDAIAGYRGDDVGGYREVCKTEEGILPGVRSCDFLDDALTSKTSMGRGFLNSLLVSIPATILPIIVAAFAAYAFSWLDFKGRQTLFAILIGLQIIPLQMTLIPIYRIYADLGLNGTFLGVWLFHTGFGLPVAIYLLRNFIGSLPTDLFEAAYLDGASHWLAFRRLVIPLSLPAIASLGIFQFLWVWNDLLVALVFLGGTTPVLTYQISNMVTSLGAGWHLLTAAAFISMLLPMAIFLAFQRYFVRGLLTGAVKGG